MSIPIPNEYCKYVIKLDKRSQGSYLEAILIGNTGYVVYDTKDSSSDNIAVLGDITGDRFQAYEPVHGQPTASLIYIGQTSSHNAIVTKFGGLYYAFANTYKQGSSLTVVNTPHPLCFASGSCIRTTRGEVAVEHLAVGDLVVTASGAALPIRWLGHRTIDCHRHPSPREAMPVRVAAHAFGEGAPERDLSLSPGHPVLVGADADGEGGQLVPIMCLINGTSVRRVAVDIVTYWHVELDKHDILLAEGLQAESYIDLGSRAWFEGADGALYDPDMALPGMPGRCRPVALDGPVVEAERRRLDAMFETRLAGACAWPGEASVAAY